MKNLNQLQKVEKIYVHGGSFHADDVFCVLIKEILLGDPIDYKRISELTKEIEAEVADGTALICDIGKKYDPEHGYFDHHQEDAPVDADGNKYSSFGQLVNYFAPDDKELKELSHAIDMSDNGIESCELSSCIHLFNPTWEEDSSQNYFGGAVGWASNYLMLDSSDEEESTNYWEEAIERRRLRHEESIANAKTLVDDVTEKSKDEVIVLDKYMPWNEHVDPTKIKCAVWESNRGGWNAWITPVSPHSFERVGDFPDHIKVGNGGCTFRHPAGMLAVFNTKEEAIEAAKTVVRR